MDSLSRKIKLFSRYLFIDEIDFARISIKPLLGVDIIDEFSDYVNWKLVSKYQVLDIDFVKKHVSKLDLELVMKKNVVSTHNKT